MRQREVFLTTEGLAKLETELEHLRSVRRQEVADRIHKAKELGGTVDNAEYEDAKNEQAFVEGRILTLENLVNNATLIPSEASPSGLVKLGSRVSVLNQEREVEEYILVGSAEASPRDGKISNESPVGQALLDKKVGDVVEVVAPVGVRKLTILDIK